MSVALHGTKPADPNHPLHDLEEWDGFVAGRYKEGKSQEEFRVYDATATPGVAEFYRLNHTYQTVDYVLGKEKEYFSLQKGQKTIWEAAEFLNTLVDDSDPDTDLTQIDHLLQTSEAIRRDGHPRWMVLVGFCTISASASACMASRSGEWSAIRSPWAAPVRRTSSFTSISRATPTATSPSTRQNTASTNRTAAWRTCT
jgi:hypothetical protein